jgi:hypothetical protein
MAYSKCENQPAVSATKLLMVALTVVVLCGFSAFRVQAQNPQQSSDESWTATTETSVENTNPSRTTESHSKSGNRSLDKQRTEVLGPDGRYRPNSETEKETVQVDAATTRTVERTYTWDGDGRRRLAQMTEEESRITPTGDTHAVRATSNCDVNGNLQVVQREVADTKKTSPDVEETKSTVYRADSYGGFTQSMQTQELKKHGADDSVEVKKTTLVPDGNGNWGVGEVTEKTVKGDGKIRTIEERVSHSDAEGRLSEVSRTVAKETETAEGARSKTVETYSGNAPGYSVNGLSLNQRVTTIQQKDSNGEIIEQQVEEPNAGNPSDSPKVTAKTKYVVRYAASGTQQTKTVQVRDGNGNLNVVSVETRKSDQASPSQVQVTPSYKPQP